MMSHEIRHVNREAKRSAVTEVPNREGGRPDNTPTLHAIRFKSIGVGGRFDSP